MPTRIVGVAATNTAVAVGAASTAILAANSYRIGLILTNDSDETIYLALGAVAVMNQGIRLNANGGSWSMDSRALWLGAVSGICASGGKNLAICQLEA